MEAERLGGAVADSNGSIISHVFKRMQLKKLMWT